MTILDVDEFQEAMIEVLRDQPGWLCFLLHCQ